MFSSIKSVLKMEETNVWLQKVYLEVDPKLNNDAPVTVHLLVIYDAQVLKDMMKNTSQQYFKKAEQIRRDLSASIDFYTWEVVPGQAVAPQVIKANRLSGQGAIVFARYQTPGDHRQSIGQDREVTVQLGRNDFTIVPVQNISD